MTSIGTSPAEVEGSHEGGGQGHGDDHPPFLAHHWESPGQQFEAAKLGMWLFLATEFLLFGGLFCAYAVFRNNHPELFEYGSKFLDVRWGAINTAVLILSSLTMAMSVTAAQMGRRPMVVALLALTFAGGGIFMGIKYVEYRHKFHENLVWGTRFYEEPHHDDAADTEHLAAATDAPLAGDAVKGRTMFLETCRSCHGVSGEGIPGQGKTQRGSAFIKGKDDADLAAFIKSGRMPSDPENTTGLQMPPKGGNPLLNDQDLIDIVAYVRTFQDLPPEEGAAEAGAEDGAAADTAFYIPRSSIPLARSGPAGLTAAARGGPETPPHEADHQEPDPRTDPERPANAHIFFGIYFLMTGLHGIHVLAGMAVIAWLIHRAVRGDFGREYLTPVDLGGLYWHVVDLIWIFLFPLFYLIG